jgi:hypothetical protein
VKTLTLSAYNTSVVKVVNAASMRLVLCDPDQGDQIGRNLVKFWGYPLPRKKCALDCKNSVGMGANRAIFLKTSGHPDLRTDVMIFL